jgi:rhamnogalacturonan endolyase
MIHGTHYQATSRDAFADGKVWGPWLWYLNDGSKPDASERSMKEESAWPYKWFDNAAYQSRGKIQGRLLLSDGRPAAGAAVFLGDNNNASISTLDQGQNYYYTTYADASGKFSMRHIRTGTYALYAWANGGPLSDVITNFTQNDIVIREGKNTNVKDLTWGVTDESKRIFQIGAWDRKSDDFGLSNIAKPYEHGRISKCPANLTYTIGTSKTGDWCFGQSAVGTWNIDFSITNATADAKLSVSLAGFSQGTGADVLLNGAVVGEIKSDGLVNSQDTYRGATRAGEWRLLEWKVGKEGLKQGRNMVSFRVKEATKWRGWLWDSVVLEWV